MIWKLKDGQNLDKKNQRGGGQKKERTEGATWIKAEAGKAQSSMLDGVYYTGKETCDYYLDLTFEHLDS